MCTTDYERFSGTLLTLAHAFGKTLPETRVRLYFEALCDLDLRVVVHAIERAVKTCEHIPSVARLRMLAYESRRLVAPPAVATRLQLEAPVAAAGIDRVYREKHAKDACALMGQIVLGQLRGAERLRALDRMAAAYPDMGWDRVAEDSARREDRLTRSQDRV